MASMDFYGFKFNGTHSSDLHILRVSNSNRYNDTILPTFQDKTVPVPGGDGTYFFESFYTNRTFTVNIAFDDLSEVQFRRLRQLLSTKNMGELIFDEAPYKAYLAKIQNPPQLNYICFDRETANSSTTSTIFHNHDLGATNSSSSAVASTTERVYKGEGTIQFVCYYPYARSVNKYLDEYSDAIYTNKGEWKNASGMLATKGNYDGNGASISLYNCGDVDADFKAYYPIVPERVGQETVYVCKLQRIDLKINNQNINTMTFNNITRLDDFDNDEYICINSKTNLIEGCDANKKLTGSVYNRFLAEGDFFKIPVTTFSGDPAAPVAMTFVSTGCNCDSIEYNYLYY